LTAGVAAVDIGTNSVRLLVQDERGLEVERLMKTTRLGQGVDDSGNLHADAIARTTGVLAEYRDIIQRRGVTKVRAAATSAARDAGNRDEFFDAAERALGARPELLSEDDEAKLSFRGATEGLPPIDAPFLVFDLGGGSTEFVLGSYQPESLISLKMGCVRMTERHLKSDPPTKDELVACFEDAQNTLKEVRKVMDPSKARTAVGLAGTTTSLAALALGLKAYDPKRTHRAYLSRRRLEEAFAKVASVNVEARRSLLIQPERAEVIVGGGAVLVTILREFGIDEIVVSETDILDGLAASIQ
jgi:exopolyphosphatase/guanosine-5'-triphosphate,3'-diphosphate pyrophosphatase